MHIATFVTIASSLAVEALAVPAATTPSIGFTVNLVAVTKTTRLWPAKHVEKTYLKYKVAVPAPVKTAAVQTGSVIAQDSPYDVAYISPVTIGTQTFNLDFDTGSSDLWVFSNGLAKSQQSGHNIYKPSTSASLLKGETWSIEYSDGTGAKGVVYADKVVVGGVTATRQAVEAATVVSSDFITDTTNDGLLGLAFSTINTISPDKQTTFFDSIKSSLATRLFTTNFKKGAAGAYDFGFINGTKYTGSITYVPISTRNGFWEFNAGAFIVGSTRFTLTIGDSIADTGTSLIYLPARVASNYYAQVRGATLSQKYGGWVVPCNASLPNMQISIGGTYFVIPGSYINFSPVGNSFCFGGIQNNDGLGFSIFGDVFLKTVFAIWDQSQSAPRLGFAKQA